MACIPMCSMQVLFPRLFLKFVAFTVGRIRRWSPSSYTGQVLHRSSFAPVKFSTGQTAQVKFLHWSRFAPVKFSIG